MTPFISEVLAEILSRKKPVSEYTFILPSKRAGSFLIHELAQKSQSAIFAPRTLSIEEFAQEISGLDPVDNVTALFEFYTVYLSCTPKENIEDFETFSAWAQTLLYDFNEIDRYLIDHRSFFGYLGEVQEVNHWYLQEEKTPLMENYLSFWKLLPRYYEELQKQLQKKNMAYQGMVYRKAAERIDGFAEDSSGNLIFVGFNALNNAEQKIFQKLLALGKAEIFWDIDEVFLKDEQHDVSLFMRQYLKKWPYYEKNKFRKISSEYNKSKDIQVTGVPGNIGQAKFVGELLSRRTAEELEGTAIVLGSENLLLPVLNSLPPKIREINITMGFPLKNAPPATLFEQLVKLHSTATSEEKWYYKDFIAVSSHPLIQKITGGYSGKILAKIQRENLVYVHHQKVTAQASSEVQEVYELIFGSWQNRPALAVENLQKLVYLFRGKLDPEKDKLTLEFLYQLHLLLNQLSNLLKEYSYITSLKAFHRLFRDLLSTKTVDFRGKPFKGLQLMGMLESRVLDFENVILTSVNEGVLPAGKSSNSFIPFDLKCTYKLPTYKEKDAVYAYHFYHLLQRAENVHLLYNTESGGLDAGGKSRFLLQLELEPQKEHIIKEFNLTPQVPAVMRELKTVPKNPGIMERIRELAGKGFSPSALTSYIRNPLDFYRQYILDIREKDEVEETVAYNTLGNVVHDVLEIFYKQWLNRNLEEKDIEDAIQAAPGKVAQMFRKHYTEAPLSTGKNLLIFEVAKRYVINFLKLEIKELKKGNSTRILEVETKLSAEFPVPELPFPVRLRGTVDRVDLHNEKFRIIDYKTGKVEQSKVEVIEWEDILTDYDKYSKPFQILTYATLLKLNEKFPETAEAGIISFKNLQKGFLKFTKKDKPGRGAKKDTAVNEEILEAFGEQLKKLILEICDPETPFVEKEIPQKSW